MKKKKSGRGKYSLGGGGYGTPASEETISTEDLFFKKETPNISGRSTRGKIKRVLAWGGVGGSDSDPPGKKRDEEDPRDSTRLVVRTAKGPASSVRGEDPQNLSHKAERIIRLTSTYWNASGKEEAVLVFVKRKVGGEVKLLRKSGTKELGFLVRKTVRDQENPRCPEERTPLGGRKSSQDQR